MSQNGVLDAAIATIAARGLAAASVQDIADAAGLSKGAVHYHFENKEALLRHVVERCAARLEARIVAAFARQGTPIERMRRAMLEMWTFRRDDAPEYRVLNELHAMARHHPAMREALGSALARSRQQIVDVGFAELLAMGLVPRVPMAVIPRLLLATLDGLALHRVLDPMSTEEEAEVLAVLETAALALFAMT